jgi:Ca2+-binding RTX toxin-like protein
LYKIGYSQEVNTDNANNIPDNYPQLKPKVDVEIARTDNDDKIRRGSGDDKITGEAGYDTVEEGEGKDKIECGEGDDRIKVEKEMMR